MRSLLGRLLCAVGVHAWRDVTRAGQSLERVQVRRRACSARVTTWETDR